MAKGATRAGDQNRLSTGNRQEGRPMNALHSRALIRASVRNWVLAVPLATAALSAAACAGGNATSTAHPSAAPHSASDATSPSGGTAAAGVAVIKTAHTSLGTVLADGRGITVYLFEKDTGTTSTCYGACAAAWPPVLTTQTPIAGAGATASLLGTIKRT